MSSQSRLTKNILQSAFPGFRQTLYLDILAIYDTLWSEGEVEESEFVKDGTKTRMIMCVICIKGNIKMRINMKNYSLSDGDAIVTPPHVLLEKLKVEKSTRVAALLVSETGYYLFPKNHTSIRKVPSIDPIYLHVEDLYLGYLENVFLQMQGILSNKGFMHKEETIRGYLQAGVGILENAYEHANKSNEGDTSKSLKYTRTHSIYVQFIKDVNEHYQTERSIAYYAALQYITPKYFGQMIMRASGRLPADIISDYVILEAKMMLGSGGNTIQQICNTLNFANASFFCKYFKAHTGLTPREFAGRYREEMMKLDQKM